MSEETAKTQPPEESGSGAHALPPASFNELVFSLRLQTELQMGLLGGGEGEGEGQEEKPVVDLPAAQHFIDLLGILADKTRGNLTMEEQRYLENSLTELRFRYVQAAEQVQKK